MTINTKYNIGDLVKVVNEKKKEEQIVKLSSVSVLVNEKEIKICYYSKQLQNIIDNIYGETKIEEVTIMEKRDAISPERTYIKCKIEIKEIW